MVDAGIYAVNAHILSTDPLHLVDICIDNRHYIYDYFNIVSKGIDEWYLKLDKPLIELSKRQKAKEILEAVKSIGDFLAKGCCDEETSKRIHEEVWELTWVW